MSGPIRPYAPCRTGLHVCGADEEENEFFTEANFPMPVGLALDLFEKAQVELGCPRADADFVVDLMVDGDTVSDFSMHRQMLARLRELAT